MNPGVLQQMNMAAAGENPNLYTMRPPPPTPQTLPYNFSPPNPFPSSLILPINPSWLVHHQQLPQSWSQPLLEGLVAEEDKASLNQFFQANNKKLEVWEENQDQDLDLLHKVSSVYVKQEIYGHANHPEFQAITKSPKSCVTTNNMLDFSSKKFDRRHPPPDRSSTECNSTSATTGGAAKKARVEPSSTQFPFKVRKEKLGDRITTLHQMVSPFGKTDTASVLLEAIGYIRFLQSQIEALSLPYLGSASGNNNNNIMRHLQQQNSVQGERSCIFPKEPGQDSINEEAKKDLRSRGLCLVPVSCTLQVGSDNGTDYWAPAFGGGFQ